MSTSCSGLVRSYVSCLRESPCMKEQHKSVTECSAAKPEECESLRYALFACRRGQVDARTRIQGNKGY
ncbi:MAG: cytochrome c oxidase assembly protein PET191 [Monoraphidium minutum]|nr:MAG: cytochrome c oxidase assembly protein PET191 [Monoraphidium minutum]